jgi:RNA polymerase II subunit A small phosphatase-like protein
MASNSPTESTPDSQPSTTAKPPRRSLFARSPSKSPPKKKEDIPVLSSPQPNPITPADDAASPPPATSPDAAASPPQGPVPTTSLAPAEPASAQPKTSTTTVASLPGTSTSSAMHPTSEPTDDADREKEKDKGSLSTTLTGTHHTRVSRKGAQTASEGAHSSTAAEKPPSLKSAAKRKAPKPPSSTPRVSFISRLFRSLVPCIGSSRTPNEAVDEVVSDPNSSAAALRDKSARDAEKDASLRPVHETPGATNESDSDQPHPGTDATSLPLVSTALNVTPPEPSAPDSNLDIVVPPTPTKVIPESETGGVTSSAVVPPGSTAEEVAHLRAQQAHEPSSGDESDGTSFTEDEEVEDVHGVDEAEDDEDRLILSGGAGIPIGSVSASSSLLRASHLFFNQRTEFLDRSYPQLPLNTWDANVLFWTLMRRWCTVASRCVVPFVTSLCHC